MASNYYNIQKMVFHIPLAMKGTNSCVLQVESA